MSLGVSVARAATLVSLAAVAVVTLPSVAAAQTAVSGGINADTTWDLAGSPYQLTGDVSVQPGATLTIEAGVEVVAMASAGTDAELIVRGALTAVGSDAAPVVFTSEGASDGAWEGLLAESGAALTLQDIEIRNADIALEIRAAAAASLSLNDIRILNVNSYGVYFTSPTTDTVSMSGIVVEGASGANYGIYAGSQRLDITGGRLSDTTTGIYATNTTLDVRKVVFDSNTGDGIRLALTSGGDQELDVDYCTFWGGGDGIDVSRNTSSTSRELRVYVNRSVFGELNTGVRDSYSYFTYAVQFQTFSENVYWDTTAYTPTSPTSATGNLAYDGLLADPENDDFEPTDRSPARYFAPEVPGSTAGAVEHAGAETGEGIHGFWFVDTTFDAGSTTDVSGDIVVAPGVTMTFLPGAAFRMAAGSDRMSGGLNPNLVEIRVEGTLEADGTNSRPVVFTSDRATPARGDWYGIVIVEDTEAFNVSQVDLGYAYRGVSLYGNDHIVAGSDIHHCSNAGIWVSGGTPEAEELELYDNYRGVYIEDGATVSVRDTNIRTSDVEGMYVTNSSVTYTTGIVRDNGGDGITLRLTENPSRTATLSSLTIAHNGGDGVDFSRNTSSSSRQLNVTTRSCSITHNEGAGLRDSYSYFTYAANFTCQQSNVWGNGSAYANVSATSGCFSYNPLYADTENRDYAPTTHSPNRQLGYLGGVAGAVEYAGDLGPQIMGYFWEDYTFTTSGSPYTMLGDLIVPDGVTVTIEPGVRFNVANNADGMQGGNTSSRAEFRVLSGGTLTTEGDGEEILFTPDVDAPGTNAWYGFRFNDSATSRLDNVRSEYAQYGAYITGPRAPVIEDGFFLYPATAGVYATDVTSSPDVEVLATQIVGTGSGNGVQFANAEGSVRSSYITHTSRGILVSITTNGSYQVYAVNNTIVHQATGIEYSRNTSSSSRDLDMYIYNNVIAESTTYATRDAASYFTYNADDRIQYNNLYNSASSYTPSSYTTRSGNITSDPQVEDDDWESFPRWWDGKLWASSLAINQGQSVSQLPSRDLLGLSRNFAGGIDIGAWEFDPDANEEPRADAVADSIMVPRGEAFELDGSAAYDPDGFLASSFWTMSDGTVTAGQTVEHTFLSAGENQEAYITVIDDDGAEDHARVVVNVNIRPEADAGPAVFQDEGPEESVFFDGTLSTDADGSVVSWLWDFGDGTGTSSAQSPRHSYASAGLYTVTLTVTDNEGLTDTDTTLATVFGTVDTAGPLIQHDEVADGQPISEDVTVAAEIQDPSEVTGALLFYRAAGGSTAFAPMSNTSGDVYQGTIPSSALSTGTMEYWFIATDGVVPTANQSTLPSGAPASGVFDFIVVGDTEAPVITHTEVADGQLTGEAVTVSATIADETGVGEAYLYFRLIGGTSFGAASMTRASGDLWTAQLPAFVVSPPGVEYYIEASDTSPVPNAGADPATAPDALYSFTVGSGDETPPIIAHTPISNGQTSGEAVVVTAGVADAGDGVASVTLHYRALGAGAFESVAMVEGTGTNWSASIPALAVTSAGVEYYIEASDEAENAARVPETAPTTGYVFSVNDVDEVGPSIVHTPVSTAQPEGVDVAIEATVTDSAGVAAVTLYYRPTGLGIFLQVAMSNTTGDTYTGAIPAFVLTGSSVEYYVAATDSSGNASSDPDGAPSAFHSFAVAEDDTEAPTIVHTPVSDEAVVGDDVLVSATVLDDSDVTVTVAYRTVGESSWSEASMTRGDGDVYEGAIPGAALDVVGMEYYVSAVDASGNDATSPADAPTTVYGFDVRPADAEGPTIALSPLDDGQPEGEPVTVSAVVFDDSDVDSVTLSYRVVGVSTWTDVAMSLASGATYAAEIPAAFVTVAGVEYYVSAVDAAPAANESVAPLTAPTTPYVFTVEPADNEGPSLVHDPVTRLSAGEALALSVDASDPSGVASGTAYWSVDGGAETAAAMADDGGTWSVTIEASALSGATSSVSYRFVFRDALGNERELPGFGSYEVEVLVPDTEAPEVSITSVPAEVVVGTAFDVTVEASDTESGVSSVTLYYRASGDATFAALAMSGDAVFTAEVPAVAVVEPEMEVYAVATDGVGNERATDTVSVAVVPVPDVLPPSLEVASPADGQAEGAPVLVSATASDASGIEQVELYYRPEGGTFESVLMDAGDDDLFTAEVPAGAVQVPAVEFYVVATDASSSRNARREPVDAPDTTLGFSVAANDEAGPTIVHVTSSVALAEGDTVELSASIVDPSGVSSASVFWRTSGGTFVEAAMSADGDTWSASVGPVSAPAMEYYFVARDTLGNERFEPVSAPVTYRSRVVETVDLEPPVIAHTPPSSVAVGASIALEAVITDESGLLGATLWYASGTGPLTSVAMLNTDADTYAAIIPGAAVGEPGVSYYIEASDTRDPANTARLPIGAPETRFTLVPEPVVTDTVGPTIAHSSGEGVLDAGVPLSVRAAVADESGVASVQLYFRGEGDASWLSTAMVEAGGSWVGDVPSFAVLEPGVEYYLEATDASASANVSRLPTDAPDAWFSREVEVPDTSGPELVHEALTGPAVASTEIPVSVLAEDASGVARVSLFFRTVGGVWLSAPLVADGDTWSGSVPAIAVQAPGFEYYLEASDTLDNATFAPASAPEVPYRVDVVVPDTEAPTVLVSALPSSVTEGTPLTVVSTVSDASGVQSVSLYFRPAGGTWGVLPMTTSDGSTYSATVSADAVVPGALELYVEALDTVDNLQVVPAGGEVSPLVVTVEEAIGPDELGPTLSHTPPEQAEAGSALRLEVQATDASGVQEVTVFYRTNSAQPYAEAAMRQGVGTEWFTDIATAADAVGELSYYFLASDASVASNVSQLPETGADAPFTVNLTGGEVDAGPDAGPDAGADAGPDSGSDAGSDSGPEADIASGDDTSVGPDAPDAFDGGASPVDTGGGSPVDGGGSGGGCATSGTPGSGGAGLLLLLGLAAARERRRRAER